MHSQILVAGGVAAVCSYALQTPVIRLLTRYGVVDVANHRSSHSGVVARGGGYGLALAACGTALSVAAYAGASDRYLWVALIASLSAAAVGAIDDASGLAAGPRLVAQGGIIFTMIALIGWGDVDPMTVPLVGFAAIWYWNAFNFMDGINGISSAHGISVGIWFAALAASANAASMGIMAACLAGASLGFLPWNFPHAKLFLGDVGSYFVGALIPVIAVALHAAEGISWNLILAPLVMYFADTGFTMWKRAIRGERLLSPHRSHVYQLWARRHGHAIALAWHVALSSVTTIAVAWGTTNGAGYVAASVVVVLYVASGHRLEKVDA